MNYVKGVIVMTNWRMRSMRRWAIVAPIWIMAFICTGVSSAERSKMQNTPSVASATTTAAEERARSAEGGQPTKVLWPDGPSATTWPGKGSIWSRTTSAWIQDPRFMTYSEAEDALGKDPGPKEDTHAWFMDHMFDHPLASLDLSLSDSTEEEREFFRRQAGLRGQAFDVARRIGLLIGAIGAAQGRWYGNPESLPGGKKYLAKVAELDRLAAECFRLVPRARRVKVYKVAQKIASAKGLIDRRHYVPEMGDTADALVEWSRRQGEKNRRGYLYGMVKRHLRSDTEAQRITEDFKQTLRFFWALRHAYPEAQAILGRTKEFEF